MMKCCPKCNGRGTVGYFHIDHFVDIECDRCNGSGEVSEVEMTNEEYLKSRNTEQLAEWMALRLNPGILLALRMKYHCADIESVREWLKEKHD